MADNDYIKLIDENATHYMKGFNGGYYLQKHEPELLAKILKSGEVIRSEYFKGLHTGKHRYENEIALNKEINAERNEEIKKLNAKTKDKDRER